MDVTAVGSRSPGGAARVCGWGKKNGRKVKGIKRRKEEKELA